jgi:predicted dehydrogenase
VEERPVSIRRALVRASRGDSGYNSGMTKTRVLVIGCGNMGASHARAYAALDDFELVGLVSRGPASREALSASLGGVATFDDARTAIAETRPDAVSINTYPDTHYGLCKEALLAGAHVFIEKPLAETVEEAQELIELARTLGKPLVMRMNLNQQSRGKQWATHRALMNSISPIVDCGVHYVDVMCQMTRAKPVRVSAIGARLSNELDPGMYNYGQLQVTFDDGSVGWYEAGWGPMMSEVAYFVKDVVGPEGCVSILERGGSERAAGSADIDSHTKTSSLKLHRAARDANDEFLQADEWIDTTSEPDHDGLCMLEQELFARAIRGEFDPTQHLEDALTSMRIVLAADESVRTGRAIDL